MGIRIHYIRTSDDLRLQGIEYEADSKKLCVLFIHGMSGNFMENYFAHIVGQTLQAHGIGFLYTHNRGYNHINDIATSKLQNTGYHTQRVGAMYEIFTDCTIDLQGWIDLTKSLGYEKIIILGHSLGAPKVIYYLSQKAEPLIAGVGLLSPGDMVGLIQNNTYQPGWEKLYEEAKNNLKLGFPRKLLQTKIWNWYTLSSQTFLSLFQKNGSVDNLPIHNPNSDFTQLGKITQPILCTMGEYDDVVIKTLDEDMDLIGRKAKNCASFTKKIIPKANHTYDGQEEVLAMSILEWMKTIQ